MHREGEIPLSRPEPKDPGGIAAPVAPLGRDYVPRELPHLAQRVAAVDDEPRKNRATGAVVPVRTTQARGGDPPRHPRALAGDLVLDERDRARRWMVKVRP